MVSIKGILVAFRAFIKGFCLLLLKAAAKQTFLFGGMGFLFLAVLLRKHSELSNDILALSVAILLGSFSIWSKVFMWVLHLSSKYKSVEIDEKATVTKIASFVAVFVLLYLGPTLLIAGVLMKLMHFAESSQVAFSMFKAVVQTDGLLCCAWMITALVRGSETVSIQRLAVERVGLSSTSEQVYSFFGSLRQHFAK